MQLSKSLKNVWSNYLKLFLVENLKKNDMNKYDFIDFYKIYSYNFYFIFKIDKYNWNTLIVPQVSIKYLEKKKLNIV